MSDVSGSAAYKASEETHASFVHQVEGWQHLRRRVRPVGIACHALLVRWPARTADAELAACTSELRENRREQQHH